MEKKYTYIVIGIILLVLSMAFHFVHYLIFHDMHHLLIFLVGDIAFLPVEVLLVSMIVHHYFEEMEKKQKVEKLNMVIGTFFSEVGTELLTRISDADPDLDSFRKKFVVRSTWSDKDFDDLINEMKAIDYKVDINKLDLEQMTGLMTLKRDFLVRLLENPTMLEHEKFTELLRAVFHFTEELDHRKGLTTLPRSDLDHLNGDVERVYGLLAREWLYYMKHVRNSYPYLFSLSMRTNPFDTGASVIVT